jgi:cytochrome c biogenesis factor
MVLSILYCSTSFSYNLGAVVLDLYLRIDLNSLGLCSLYWLWTNTYYLYTLFVSVLVLFFYLLLPIKYSFSMVLIAVYFLLLLSEMFYNLSMSITCDLYDFNMGFYNLLLNNSINKIHPALIYSSIASLFILVNYLFDYKLYYQLLHSLINKLVILLISLVLGGWWAYQEGSWGGWWNWDASEMFGLAIFISIVLTSHNIIYTERVYLLLFRNVIAALTLYYSFLQLNFSLISHNFGIRQGDLVDFRVVYLLLLPIIIIATKLTVHHLLREKHFNHYVFSGIELKTAILFILVVFITYSTTSELWSSLLWKILAIDLQNELKLVDHFNLYLLLVLIVNYLPIGSQGLLPVLTIPLLTTPLLLILLPAILIATRLFNARGAHMALILLLLFTTYYSKFSILDMVSSVNYTANNAALSLNMPLLETINNFSTINRCEYATIESSLTLNTGETKAFTLANLNFYTLQAYYTSLSDVVISSLTYDYYNVLPVMLTIIVTKLGLSYLNYYVISF